MRSICGRHRNGLPGCAHTGQRWPPPPGSPPANPGWQRQSQTVQTRGGRSGAALVDDADRSLCVQLRGNGLPNACGVYTKEQGTVTRLRQGRSMGDKLTPEELAEFREIFNLVDKDGGGTISKEELGELMETLGIDATPEEIDLMIAEIDEDNNGVIDFDEFVAVMSRKVRDVHRRAGPGRVPGVRERRAAGPHQGGVVRGARVDYRQSRTGSARSRLAFLGFGRAARARPGRPRKNVNYKGTRRPGSTGEVLK